MEERKSHFDIIALVVVGLLAIFLAWWFGFRDSGGPVVQPAPPKGPVAVDIVLPKDLRVLSGRVAEKLTASIAVEWSVPRKTDLKDIDKYVKRVSWDDSTVFEKIQTGGANPVAEKIKSSEIKVGSAVLVTTASPVQSSDDLLAERIQVLLPPKVKAAK